MTPTSIPARRMLALLAIGALAGHAQYSTPVGQGAAKPKTLRATAVLEWTGTLEKPNASRLMPIAVWDGEQYQPAGLYLAQPEPLAFAAGTQYELERAGEEAGLFEVRAAAQLNGQWIGMGKFEAQPAPPPPKKLKVSKELPVLQGGNRDSATAKSGTDSSSDKPTDDDRPTLHRAPGSSSPTETPGSSSAPASAKPSSDTPASDAPTLHRRTGAGADTSQKTDPDAGTASKAPDVDPDRPTLHKHSDTSDADAKPSDADADPDRPTLHRARTAGGLAASSATIDPDRPRLRYGAPDEPGASLMPAKLEGAPPAMQQIVAVSDASSTEPHPYHYQWPDPGDAAKMQADLAQLAAQTVAAPAAPVPAKNTFGPQAAKARAAARTSRAAHGSGKSTSSSPAPALVDEKFAAYELSFSGGATLVYSAHTAAEGADQTYVTLIAQPDFNGKPQVIFSQVSHADRLAETPQMQLVDAVDTDGDGRAELVFALTGPSANTASVASALAAADHSSASADSAGPERQFAIYRVAGGRAKQVFATGPLP